MTEPVRFPVAIVGAADLPALEEFLAASPADGDIAYLVVMSGRMEADLPALLQPHTPLPIHLVAAMAALEQNHIYILPPARTIAGVELPCRIVTVEQASLAPMDSSCKLLAPALGVYALGVVLGGEGADGALGLTHIRAAGGLTAVQEPHGAAAADAIPLHALAAGPVDLALPPPALAAQIVAFGRRLLAAPPWSAGELPAPHIQEQLRQIQTHMLRCAGQDLSIFAPRFLLRKIEKRRMLLDLPDLAAYAHLVGEQGREVQLLCQEVLSSARQFWRQPQSLAALAENALVRILHAKDNAGQVRVWVAGCAGGEEAYTICILLLETAAALGRTIDIRLFATDLQEEAIQQAREGLFPATIAADISAERLQRFFTPEGDSYRIGQFVRQQIIFAQHDLFHTPPFLKLDLIVCRNLLGALTLERQQQLFALFYQCLQPQGYLFTGSSEVVQANYFHPAMPGQPLYQRHAGAGVNNNPSPLPFSTPLTSALHRPDAVHETLYSRQLQRHIPPGLLVDADFTIVYYSADVSPYLHQPVGAATEQVLQRVRPELRDALSAALMHTAKTGEPACSQPVTLAQTGAPQCIQVCVEPAESPAQQKLLLVFFRAADPPLPVAAAAEDSVAHLNIALTTAYQKLQAASEEYTTMSEEMSVTNEELLSLNEELHLKAMELERSKEELLAANEELLAINRENQRNLEQLPLLTANLQNLMAATNIPALFLDSALQIRWFSPALSALFNVLPGDEGRPLAHVTHHLHYSRVAHDAIEVMTSAEPRELELSSNDDAWYLMRILPYRITDHLTDGVIITFFDITLRKQAEESLQQLNASLEQRVEERTLELARSNRELDQFAYIASHDLKAPLRAITNLAQWIQKDNVESLPSASQEHLTKLRGRIARMERLLEDLLTYSRVGRQLHKPEWVDTTALMAGLHHVLPAPSGFRIEMQRPLPAFFTERVPLETVLRNLIGNAIKHHDRPQEGVVEVAAVEYEKWVEFAVKDNGPGIAPQFHERIFQIFQSLRPRDEVEGSGMGLAIVKKAVESQGGWVQVESQAGQGATFRFSWPKAAGE